MKKVLNAVMGVFAVVGVLLVSGCEKSVSDYRAEKFQEIKAKIASEPSWVYLMQKVLDARHKSVRAKSIEVEDLVVQTLGDDAAVKRDLSNLKSVDVKFRILWDGTFHKDGFTCTTFVFDKEWNVVRIIPGESNAKIDLMGPKDAKSANEGPGKAAQLLDAAKQKMDEVVKASKEKWESMKPQMSEGLKKLENQVDLAIQKMEQELH